ncbi:MEDS domain-containing protein [Catellatospora sp. NPDC049609]|uniref:MEDS domain-containing protein n=1 Tax=Catellatospora sp. NPDC049609 TaxID=3155505 RepID=UPI0034224759
MTEMFSLIPGDHAAIRFATAREFADNAVDFARRGLTLGGQILIFPAVADLGGAQERITGDRALREAVSRGHVRTSVMAPAGGSLDTARLREQYRQATASAVEAGYTGLWVTADTTWVRPLADAEALIHFEAGSHALFSTGRLTALCQYDTGCFDERDLRRAFQAHPTCVAGCRLRFHHYPGPALLVVVGDTDLSNSVAFAHLIGDHDRSTIDISGMGFVDGAGLSLLARRTRRTGTAPLRCTTDQAQLLRLLGADPAGLELT